MKIVFLETTDSDSASHHSYNREEKGKTLFFQKQFFVTRFISTLLIYNSIIQSKARLMFINVFFFASCKHSLHTTCQQWKKHECDWVLNVATCTEWPVNGKTYLFEGISFQF